MKTKLWLLAIGLGLALTPVVVLAVVPALRMTGAQISSQSSSPVSSGSAGIWNNSGTFKIRASGGTDTSIINGTPAATGDVPYSTSGGAAVSFLSAVAAGSVVASNGVGAAPIYTTTPTVGAITLTNTSNQLTLGSASHNVVISSTAPAASTQTLTIPDTAGAATFAFTNIAQTISAVFTFSSPPLIQIGTGGGNATTGGVLYKDVSAIASVTTGETDASVYTMPANTLTTNGQILRISAAFTHANNTNSATGKLYVNGVAIVSLADTSALDLYGTDCRLVRINATTASALCVGMVNAGGYQGNRGSVTIAAGSSMIIKTTVTGATTNGDTTSNFLVVQGWN